MAGSVLSISKGAMFQAMDHVLATPPPGQTLTQWYRHLRQQLIDGQDSLSAVAAQVGAIHGNADVAHVQDEALGENRGFWPTIHGKEQTLREGFIAAYDMALSRPTTRPIVAFWSVVAEPDVFEVLVTGSPNQVTLFWVTTEPPGWGSCVGHVEEEMHLVAPRSRVERLRGRFTGSTKPVARVAGADENPSRQAGDLRILHLRGD